MSKNMGSCFLNKGSEKALSREFLVGLFGYHPNGYLVWKNRPDKPDHVNRRFRGRKAGSWSFKNSALQIHINGKLYLAHRLIWIYHFGEIPEGKMIDHRDMNKRNNRISNLRIASNRQNQQNRASMSGKNYKGVTKAKRGKYKAEIRVDGKLLYLGLHDSPWEAAVAYNEKAKEIHGEFFQPNIRDSEFLHKPNGYGGRKEHVSE